MASVRCLIFLVCAGFLIGCEGKPGHWKHGGGEQHFGEEYSSHGEEADKGYAAKHEEESGAKGHHDKENHSGHYGEDGGHKSSHHHDDGHYSAHHSGEKGSKGSHFEESGSFSKGHNIKGSHSIHDLDEYKKNTGFFSEDHDEAYKVKHGANEESSGYHKGGHGAGGHYKKVFFGGDYGRSGKFEKGSHFNEAEGNKGESGKVSYYGNNEKYGSESGKGGFKKWGH